jgi:hypothetical protein
VHPFALFVQADWLTMPQKWHSEEALQTLEIDDRRERIRLYPRGATESVGMVDPA